MTGGQRAFKFLNLVNSPNLPFERVIRGEFPGDPVVRPPPFHWRAVWVQSLVGELISSKPVKTEMKQKTETKVKNKRVSLHCLQKHLSELLWALKNTYKPWKFWFHWRGPVIGVFTTSPGDAKTFQCGEPQLLSPMAYFSMHVVFNF